VPTPAPETIYINTTHNNVRAGPTPSPTHYITTSATASTFVSFPGTGGYSEQYRLSSFSGTASFSWFFRWQLNNAGANTLLATLYQRAFSSVSLDVPATGGSLAGTSGYEADSIYLQFRGGNSQFSVFVRNNTQMVNATNYGFSMSPSAGIISNVTSVWIDYNATTALTRIFIAPNTVVKPVSSAASFTRDYSANRNPAADVFFNVGYSFGTVSTVDVFDYIFTCFTAGCCDFSYAR
jgi:hypothetical protein